MDLTDFDELKLYFAEDYKINDKITIHQPTSEKSLRSESENILTQSIHSVRFHPI